MNQPPHNGPETPRREPSRNETVRMSPPAPYALNPPQAPPKAPAVRNPPAEVDIEKVRVPLPGKVNIVVNDFGGFVSEYASNISKGGMFIATDSPRPVGSVLEFDIRLADDYALITGRGVVVRVRSEATSEAVPQGWASASSNSGATAAT